MRRVQLVLIGSSQVVVVLRMAWFIHSMVWSKHT